MFTTAMHKLSSHVKGNDTQWSNSPRGSPQLPAGWQKLPFVQGYNPYGRLHDRDELLKLHLLTLLWRQQHHTHRSALTAAATLPSLIFSQSATPEADSTSPRLLVSFRSITTTSLSSPWQRASTRCGEVPVAELLRVLSPTADSDRCPFGFSERGRIKGKQTATFLPGGGRAERGWQHVTLT